MVEVSGDFEIHVTVDAHAGDKLAAFAVEHGLKFVHIVLDRGAYASQLDAPVMAASAPLSLAWKLQWLATDTYPQGKDLYDAVLLAEYTTVDQALVRELIRPDLGAEADLLSAETVLSWPVDWTNFIDEYPSIAGTAEQWTRRLALALDRAWT